MTSPGISVLVPAFRDGALLAEALASLAAQSERDFEVVIAVDGEDAATLAVVEEWRRRDERIRSLEDRRHLGMTANWNRALAAARGEWVAKLDADDAWESETLARLRAPFAGERDLLASFCRAVECDASMRPAGAWHGEAAFAAAGLDVARDQIRPGGEFLAMSFDDRQLWHSNAFLMRRAELLALGGWDERWSCAADTDLILRVLERDRPVSHSGYVGVRYRRRAGSVSEAAERDGWKTLEAILSALASLGRAGAARAERSAALRQNWWRLWRAFEAMRDDEAVWNAVPATSRAGLRALAAALEAPPLGVRVAGDLRLGAWKLKRALTGRSA